LKFVGYGLHVHVWAIASRFPSSLIVSIFVLLGRIKPLSLKFVHFQGSRFAICVKQLEKR